MIDQINSIDVTWIVKDEMSVSFYHGGDFSVKIQDDGEQIIRFSLKNIKDHGEDPFQVILSLRESEKRFSFKADCYDNPEERYLLRMLRSDENGEIILICDDEGEQIFFDISL
jgi:DNA polymerase III alpha subunit